MVIKRLKPIWAALAVLIALLAVGTKADAAKPNYVISTDATYAPFDFQDKNNQYVGIDMDILKEVAKRNNFTYTLKPMSFNAAAQMVANGQADGIIAGMMINDSRKEVYDVSDPYYQSGVAWITKPNSSIKSLNDLKGKKVALKTGTAAAAYGASLKDQYGFDIKYFNDTDTMYNDVVNGNTDATFEDYPVIQYAIKNGVKLQVRNADNLGKAGGVGFFVKKGQNAQLLDQFNKSLEEMKKDGTYNKIIDKYLNSSQKNFVGNASDNKTTLGILKSNSHAFMSGLWQTAELSVAGIVLASLFGLILGVMGIAQSKLIRGISTTIIYIFRGLPLMVLAFFIYIGLPGVLGMKIPAFTAGILTLILNEGAYTGAFVRGGFEAVDAGQMEAARSLGLTHRQATWKVIVPQGLKITVPSFVNQFIITLKDTSILSAIGILELTQTGTLIVARNSQGFRVWAIIAVIYLIVITLLSWFSNWLKKKIA
ncbi:ABC transporter substrate-binding protein/permease [Fructobacillus sp. M2-14]|uniref:ABC transporter substrate-binding protein/permease n=1 Tax=Fructobacillus broussonetiae TaxID=2713173 RepID=A0ABS5QZC2_9LACO|nr:ABC transporter substrate-binding protein/permease [Fructobacillus broussonetiae]MBS9338505.1 ABC transporter substrate-binding protein/permease [Fructobacillus broussonetiae]